MENKENTNKEITLTKEQEAAINNEGNIIVSAAAGAGKTFVMTNRILRNILEGTKVDELLVVTFMKLAANDMKAKIEKKLVEYAEKETDEEKRTLLFNAASGLSRADISTIHSFCKNVLARNYHKLGIDPAFRVLDETEANTYKARAIEDTIEEFCLKTEQNRDEESLFLISTFKGTDGLKKAVKTLYDFIIARPEPIKWLEWAQDAYLDGFDEVFRSAEKVLIDYSHKMLQMNIENGKILLETGFFDDEDMRAKVFSVVDDDRRRMEELLEYSGYDEFRENMEIITGSRVLGSLPKKAGADVKEYRDSITKSGGLRDLLKGIFRCPSEYEKKIAGILYQSIKKLCALTVDFMERYNGIKREEAAVDFSDLEQLCFEALKDENIANEYREKYRYIFVDEFQDINMLQDSIIRRISRDDNVFLVGDVKQSIYVFRQAEPQVFIDKCEEFDGVSGKRIDLTMNFRSETSILSATNAVFKTIMTGAVGDLEYTDKVSLEPRSGAGRGGVELDLIELSSEKYSNAVDLQKEGADGEEKVESSTMDKQDTDGQNNENNDSDDTEELGVIEAEAGFIADKILELMADENRLVYDEELKKKRRLRYSDFAVLMRKTSLNALQTANKLSEKGIPSVAELTDGFFDAIEVKLVMNVLKCIDNARRDIPLVSVLLSPIEDFDEKELAEIKIAFPGGKSDCFSDKYHRAVRAGIELLKGETAQDESEKDEDEDEEEDKKKKGPSLNSEQRSICIRLAAFHKKLQTWREKSRFMGVAEFIGTIVDETRIRSLLGALPNGEVRRANIDLLIEKARGFEASGGRSLYGFLTLMNAAEKKDNKVGAAHPPENDAVRILSIHKSKGLEYPVVFLCALGARFNKRDLSEKITVDRDMGIGLNIKNGLYMLSAFAEGEGDDLSEEEKKERAFLLIAAEKNIMRRAMEKKAIDRLVAEEMRILYVAMTRAREQLYLVSAKCDMSGFIAEKARKLNPADIISSNSFIEWLLGTFFPLGLNLKNAADGLTVPIPGTQGERDEIGVRYLLAAPHDGNDGTKKGKAFEEWRKNAEKAEHSEYDELFKFEYLYDADTKRDAKKSVTQYLEEVKSEKETTGKKPGYYEYVPAVPNFLREKKHGLNAAERGTVTHRFMQLMPLKMLDEAGIRDELEALKERGFFTEDEAAAVDIGAVKAFIDSPLFERMLASGEVLREKEFSFIDEETGTLVQGTVDCCFVENGEIVIIDYKTNAVNSGDGREVAESYQTQIDMYEKALTRLRRLPVKEKWIYLLSVSKAHLLD